MTYKEVRYHKFYMDLALRVAEMSYAVRRKVGCVIVKDDNILSFGWNGMPAGMDNVCEYKQYDLSRDFNGNHFPDHEEEYPFINDKKERYKLVTNIEVSHAEENAIAKIARSNQSSHGATAYVTLEPCMHCAKLIYSAGIEQVYIRELYTDHTGADYLISCGVNVNRIY